jgi:hypothetical protein
VTAARTSAIVRRDRLRTRAAETRRRLAERAVEGLEIRPPLCDRGQVSLDRRPVASDMRARRREAVLDRPAHERLESFRWCAGRAHELRRGLVERDEEARRDGCARVVEGPVLVREREGLEAEQVRELETGCEPRFVLGRDRGPRAVELFGAARVRKRLERVEAEAAAVRCEGVERGHTARVSDPAAGGNGRRRLRYRPVGNAEQHEVGTGAGELTARRARRYAARKPRGDGGADSAAADHADGFEVQRSLQFRSGYRAL